MMQITLCSWNIWGGIMLPQITEYLANTAADIIALQEAQEENEGNTAEELGKRLGYRVSYAYSMDYLWEGKKTRRGNAILSKFPIIASHPYILSSVLPRTALGADIAIKDTMLHAISLHLIPHFPDTPLLQQEQITTLVRTLPKDKTVIMGDFNATPESEVVTIAKEHLTDTDPQNLPTWCLYPDGPGRVKRESVQSKYDYILKTSDLAVTNFAVGQSDASDHLPILATLRLS